MFDEFGVAGLQQPVDDPRLAAALAQQPPTSLGDERQNAPRRSPAADTGASPPSRPRHINQHPSANTPISAVPAADHRPEAPVHEPDDRHVVARTVLSDSLGLEFVDPRTVEPVEKSFSNDSAAGSLTSDQQVPRVGRKPGQGEQRQPGRASPSRTAPRPRPSSSAAGAAPARPGSARTSRRRPRTTSPIRSAMRATGANNATSRPRSRCQAATANTSTDPVNSDPNTTCAVVNATFQLKSTGPTSTSCARPSTSS